MSRYIDADALIADMRERYCTPCQKRKEDYNGVKCRACWVDDAMDDVDGFGDNGIDIVRCKECRHWCNHKDADYDQSEFTYYCEVHGISLTGNDYCSYGEREGE